MKRHNSSTSYTAFLLTALLSLFICNGAFAQTNTSSVRGTVTDPQGGAVAGATVTITSTDTNSARTQSTNEDGNFVFDLIPPGAYRLEAEATGFKKAALTDIRALVAKATEVGNVQLEVGNVAETVTVSAGSGEVLVNTQDATIGNNFDSQQITQLPLESRNVVQLLSLQPGVTPDGYVTGSRADQANITLDGVDVNEQQRGIDPLNDEAFSSVLRVSADSIQEFRVTVTNPNASQGRSSGGQVALLTKSGTNEFSGSLYEFHRNTVTTANDFFNNRAGRYTASDPQVVLGLNRAGDERVPRPKLLRNVFGGTLGGPIVKDRAFFFYSYEGRRDAREQSVVRTVPLASLGRGEVRFPNTSGGITTLTASDINRLFPAVGVNPVGLAVLADAARKYQANDFTLGDSTFARQLNTAGFRFNASVPVNLNAHSAKLNFNLTKDGRHQVYVRGNYQDDLFGRASEFPDTPSQDFLSTPKGLAANHTWTINSKMVNSFTYGLTREAFTDQGDSTENSISFRFVFSPRAFTRTLSRTTPVHNFTDDFSLTAGNHGLQFGTNIRLIRNDRTSFANAYDSAIANPSFYSGSGNVLSRPISGIGAGFTSPVRNAVSAVLGRFSQYSANFNFDREGNVLPAGTGVQREFATEEYDVYAQDIWRVRPNLTLTLGLRYGLSRPVYETSGLQVKPTVSLGEFFERRRAGAAAGRPVNDLITVDLAGPANNRPGYYEWDKNNFQPRLAFAYSPDFKSGFLHKLFGDASDSVIRGGFAMTNDYYGQQLAVQFDLNSTLGFSSAQTISANTYNVTNRPAPLFTGFGQNVRALPGLPTPGKLTFPLVTPADESERIESSLDDTLIAPTNYSWNVSFERQMPAGVLVSASYIGRSARALLGTRDIMHLNNLVDQRSGVDWYTAAGQLADLRSANTPIGSVQPIPYFENLFPGIGDAIFGDATLSATQAAYSLVARDGEDILDWTYVQSNDLLDDLSILGRNAFFHPQYAAFAAFGNVGSSDYHAGTLSVRQRLGRSLLYDFNYTFSKSMDNVSGLQSSTSYGSAFVTNPLSPDLNRSVSDFDLRHIVNANAIWQLPVGRGRALLGDSPGFIDAIIGGWQLSGVYRWNSGRPVQTPFDASQWATNWNSQSNGVRIRPIQESPTRGGTVAPNLFSDPVAAYRSFRNARAGEVGDRNVFRRPGYIVLDAGLSKSFTMPWSESHTLQFRAEVFNVSNTQRMGTLLETREGLGLGQDPDLNQPAPSFGNFTGIQGSPRVMQFGLRYQF